MKQIKSIEEFNALPAVTQMVYINASMGIPMGSGIIDKAMKASPEIFEEEIQRRNLWESIPQEVKDAYWRELNEKMDELPKHPKAGMGMVHYVKHPKDLKEVQEHLDKYRPLREQIDREIHDKYFKQYGLEYFTSWSAS